jgi:hypothetical protein
MFGGSGNSAAAVGTQSAIASIAAAAVLLVTAEGKTTGYRTTPTDARKEGAAKRTPIGIKIVWLAAPLRQEWPR